jgi:hypothetical protein
MSNLMTTDLITWTTWTNSLIDTISQNSCRGHLNRPIPIKQVKSVINCLLKHRIPGPGDIYKTFKE